jgi:hypothetical protein
MRGTCLLLLVLLSACAMRSKQAADLPAEVSYGGEGLVYETPRPASASAPGTVRADLTLLELDAALAQELLGIEAATDIAPRSFTKPMGEIAAVNACFGGGRVIVRPSIEVKPNTEASWQWSVEHVYVQDWKLEGDAASPVFGTITEGVELKLTFMPVNIGDSIKLESVSTQIAAPIQTFTTTLGPANSVKIQMPHVLIAERVGTETLRPGETAMFQLSRAGYEDGTRIRLLFVRLVAAE